MSVRQAAQAVLEHWDAISGTHPPGSSMDVLGERLEQLRAAIEAAPSTEITIHLDRKKIDALIDQAIHKHMDGLAQALRER